jgi:hypothetical protein
MLGWWLGAPAMFVVSIDGLFLIGADRSVVERIKILPPS